MKLKRIEMFILIVSFLFLSFTAGYFVGRSSVESVVSVETQRAGLSEDTAYTDWQEAEDSLGVSEETEEETKPAETTKAAEGQREKININTAGVEELDALSGIGETLAGRIVAYREENGNFENIQEIMNVRGIGDKIFEKIQEDITV